jgi:TRAP-type C4-dicarboxylate transport system substrate-binding protein
MSRSLSVPVPVVASVVACVLALGACTGGANAGDKSGSSTLVLRMAAIDPVADNPQYVGPATFVEQLELVSEGRLRVEVDTDTFAGHGPDAESDLVSAIASGEVDGGWPATRAFSAAGIDGLEVVEAPMTLTSHAAVGELVTSPLADGLLGRLDGTGVVGLAMTVGPLRRPFAVEDPLLGPDTWAGTRVRSYNSPVQDAAFQALGATPVRVGTGWLRLVGQDELDALELDVAQYYANGHTTEAGHLTTDVVLWPKVFVPAISQQRWDSLSEQQREWVSRAADLAREASVGAPYDDRVLLEELCSRGLEAHQAGDVARADLTDRLRPVVEDLADDPLWPEIVAIARRHRPDVLSDVACVPRADYEVTRRIAVPDTLAEVPDGTYRVSLSSDEVLAALGPGKSSTSGVWTLRVRAGAYELDCVPHGDSTGSDCDNTEDLHGTGFDVNPMMAGRVHGDGEVAYFVNDPQVARARSDCTFPAGIQLEQESCYPRTVDRVSWTFDGTLLAFTDLLADVGTWQLVVKPWERIAD